VRADSGSGANVVVYVIFSEFAFAHVHPPPKESISVRASSPFASAIRISIPNSAIWLIETFNENE